MGVYTYIYCIQVITMIYILSILICIYSTIHVYTPTYAANIHNTGHTILSRTSRQAPSCSIVTSACSEGKELKFRGSDVCSKCKYCTGGKEECAKKCKLGKSSPTCQHCINNCGVRR